MDSIVVGDSKIYYLVDNNKYLTISKMTHICLYNSPIDGAKLLDTKLVPRTTFLEVLRDGTSEDQLDYIYNEFSSVANSDIPEDVLEFFASVLFDTRVLCSVSTAGPYINFGTCVVTLGENNGLVLKDVKTGRTVGRPYAPDVYSTVKSSSVPREVVRAIVNKMLKSTNNLDYQKYMMYTSVMDEFADYIKIVSETEVDSKKVEVFNSTFIPERTPIEDISVTFRNGNLEINNNGKIIIIEGGDGIALSTKDGILTVSTKGLKKETINSKTFEEAMSKVAAKTLEVLRPCGSKAVTMYNSKIKPEMAKITKEVVTQAGVIFDDGMLRGKSFTEKVVKEREQKNDESANPRSFSNSQSKADNINEEYEDKRAPKKVKANTRIPNSTVHGGNKESPFILYASVGVIVIVIILIALS